MTDIVDQHTRSRMMSGIRGKNTKPELALRMAMHARGFRYRLHAKDIHWRADLVFPEYHAAVFVHGCFWHRHSECRCTTTPSTRPEFWRSKFEANTARDSVVKSKLLEQGWRVATVWECAVRKADQVDAATGILSTWLRSEDSELEIGEIHVAR
jgi:DNA mismatch endonuclease (patch repair protein)